MTASTDRWWALGHDLLDAVVDGYDRRGLLLPEYRIVCPTPTPPDISSMVSVGLALTSGTDGDVSAARTAPVSRTGLMGQGIRAATYTVSILRQVANIDDRTGFGDTEAAPHPDAYDANARILMGDHAALVESIVEAYAEERLGVSCGMFAVGVCTTTPLPVGGLSGVRLNVLLGGV